MADYESLKIENQLCFPLYACAKEIVRSYQPLLSKIDLTYTQYITMMVMWERKSVTVKELGEILYLDSGTLTPLLKKLEAKGYVTRKRSRDDERSVIIEITKEGMDLREAAASIPEQAACRIVLTPEEARTVYKLMYKMLAGLEETNDSAS